ncbi:arginyltransferase [Ahrensia marina]|uniref:Aspartate/glutamate leucyltransferase n=1 Tax=Ahrensia marina TaxID=1514904 RepID=A0A0N0VLR1_9HYPH|nr:arginyltransferase [Ahrensia marina]KPB01794.1 arginyl-tRNA-protein transferase [Ahrensia marina]
MTQHDTKTPQFFLTSPSRCPYLEDQMERKVFTHLVGEKASEMNELLTQGGFRRSQNIAYRPACESCRSCISIRIMADEFKPTKSMRRIINANQDLIGVEHNAEPTSEQFSLFRAYLDSRHRDGGMSDMTALDYAMMVEDTHVNTKVIEYRRRGPDSFITGQGEGPLVGVSLCDRMSDGYSMVYSFFDPDSEFKSLGTWIILDHISRANAQGLPFVYLGYWVADSPKMEYKSRFKPQQHLTPNGWELYRGK